MSISIGANSILNSTISTMNTTNGLQDKLSNTNNQSDEQLMEACKSFENYFVEQVFKEMRKTVPTQEENDYLNYFGDMQYEKYAENITDSGNLGIAQMLFESMKRN